MFFIVSKILGFFAIPSNLLIMLALLGAALVCTRFARAGWRLLVGGVLALAICGLSPLGNALILPLEQRFPPWDGAAGAPDGIVVLGGAITPDVSTARNAVTLNEAAERMTAVAALARRYPAARIVLSGGLAHSRPRRCDHAVPDRWRWLAPNRHGRTRMGRACGLLAYGPLLIALSGTDRGGRLRWRRRQLPPLIALRQDSTGSVELAYCTETF